MAPARLKGGDLARALAPGGLTYVQGCSAESLLWLEELCRTPDAWGDMTFTGIFVPGLNHANYLIGERCRTRTFFMTPELRRGGDRVDFLPLCYGDILRNLRTQPIAAALFKVTPPDDAGWCSFGPVVDFLAELWPRIPIRIAHIDASLPRTRGPRGIPFDELTAVIEAPAGPLCVAGERADPVAEAIARHVARQIPDGATVQTGLGRVPAAVLQALRDHRNLRIHSGLIGDGVLALRQSGALAAGAPVTAGVAIGSAALYAAISGPEFVFQPVSHTHAAEVIAGLDRFVAVNSALEVDLYGQAHSELTPAGLMSGPGGATDFARGARLAAGLSIAALPSAAKGRTRIVPAGAGLGPVSMSRFDIDLVVTEHGVADLRGHGHSQRARALIAIADPGRRDDLARSWSQTEARL
ncbi:MAG TPA: acetyl-CoA hydrolase/transferase C-terminal domain-containing protein [Caulobacteraceae bacterium]